MFQLKEKPLPLFAPSWKHKESEDKITYIQTRKAEIRKPQRLPIKSMQGFLYRRKAKKGNSFKKIDFRREARIKEIEFDKNSVISVQPAPSMDMASNSVYRDTFRSGNSKEISLNKFAKSSKSGLNKAFKAADDDFSKTQYYKDLNRKRSEFSIGSQNDKNVKDLKLKEKYSKKNDPFYISKDLKLMKKDKQVNNKKKRVVYKGVRDKRLKLGLSFLPFVEQKNTLYSKNLKISNGKNETEKSKNEEDEEDPKSKADTYMATLSEFVKLKHEKMTKKDQNLDKNYSYLKDAKSYKITELIYDDEEFCKTTKPTEAFNQALFHFDTNKKKKDYFTENVTEAEFVLTQDVDVILQSDLKGKARVYADIMIQAIDHKDFFNDDIKVKKAAENMFTMVDTFIKNPNHKEKNFLPGFFDVCHKLNKLYKEKKKEGGEENEVMKQMVSDTSLAMNTLVHSLKDTFCYIPDAEKLNMIKGYIQHLFFIFYDLTSLKYEKWKERLQLMRYKMLTIPRNVNIFFSDQKLLKIIFEDEDFKVIFRRFYTSIVTLILRSEFLKSADNYIWKFVLDCFALHFSFIRLTRVFPYCEEIWDFNEFINSENIFLRFITTINIFPYELVLNSEIKHSLSYNLVMLAKHFENLKLYTVGKITFVHKAIIRKIFSSSFELLESRYNHEDEQYSILRIIYCYMQILNFYINYNTEYGSVRVVKEAVLPFKSSFREMLYKLQSKKTVKKCMGVNEMILESILMCNQGLDRMKEVSRVKRKIASLLEKKFKKSSRLMDVIAEEDQKMHLGLLLIPKIKEEDEEG